MNIKKEFYKEFLGEMKEKYSHIEEVSNDMDMQLMELELSEDEVDDISSHSYIKQTPGSIVMGVGGSMNISGNGITIKQT